MAHVIPSDLTRLALAGANQPEIRTLANLKDVLPDDYTVFHGVHWTRQHKGNTVYGEIDFVILNRDGKALCIEQKNGPLIEDDAGLHKDYGTSRKNVGDQIHRSLNSIREKAGFQIGKSPGIELEYLIYCPDHAVKVLNAASLDRERVVDAPRARVLPAVIQSILGPGSGNNPRHAAKVEEFFRQTFDLVPDIHAHIGAQEKNFIRLSGGLVQVLSRIMMQPLRLHVLATAGNGKTLVARHFYDKAVSENKRPLLLCFNRPLSERLKRIVAAGGTVETWYGFCDHFLQQQGRPLDFSQMGKDPDFWLKAREQVTKAIVESGVPDEWRFSTLVVDEAQDFEEEWWQVLRLFVSEESDILWLEDPNQNLRGVASERRDGFVGYRSLLNYRSPESIATFIQRTMPEFEFECANDLPGLGVGISHYDAAEDQPGIVGKIIGRLVSQRFRLEDIVILSCRGLQSTVFSQASRAGQYTLAKFAGGYDLFGNQQYTTGQVAFDTVRRFKGQQAAAVILVDVDPRLESLAQELQIIYCGMTRATVRLELVCNAGNRWVKERLHSAAG